MKVSELFEGLRVSVLDDGLEVVEPDFLVDISSLAACFQDYGHHPLSYLMNRLKASANTQPILLGNFAGTALDSIIHQADADFGDMLRDSFQEQALQFCTCDDFHADQFKQDARQQVANIREAVGILFSTYDRRKALLEPSFVCRHLGLRGRVDLMTDDLRLLVEQKSGKKWVSYREAHYVQVLLYYGVLHYNFQQQADGVDIRLLYSKYPASQGLLDVRNNQELFREAIRLRNQIVALEIQIARRGFASVLPLLQADVLLQNPQKSDFFHRFVAPEVERLLQPLRGLPDEQLDYVERMMTFVYREQLAQQLETEETIGLKELTIDFTQRERDDIVVLKAPSLAEESDADFRRGDMVYLFRYEDEPDIHSNILYKGVIDRLTDREITIRLNDPQHHFSEGTYAIEHATSDVGNTSAIRSLMAFCRASKSRRDLLSGQRTPRCDESLELSRSYHPAYDEVLLHAKQARDYFLLQGPPGTGKTSMALRFLVEEELNSSLFTPHSSLEQSSLLLTAYTHRAVDEICAMLEESGQDYLRLGNEAACDPRFAHRLLRRAFSPQSKLGDIRQRLLEVPIVVSTTLTLQSRPYILSLKHFSLCIVDEASQILEPHIIGLLASDHIDRFILIGDHKQLPAVIQQADDEPRLHACRQSLFERLLHQETEAGRTAFTDVLRRQGRMHPDIAAFPNEMFYAQEQLQTVPLPHQLEDRLDYGEPSEDEMDDVLKQHRVLFLDADDSEAQLVADLLRRIYRQMVSHRFDVHRSIGVIVTYRHQIAQIRREIDLLGISPLLDISIDTVERYQGSQRDVIIYALGVQDQADLEFVTAQCFEEQGRTVDRKLNVAMTRARKQLLMTGKQEVLQQNNIFRELIRRYSI